MRTLLVHGGSIKNLKATKFDREFVSLSKKKNPKILLILNAKGDNKEDIRFYKNIFEDQLKAKIDVLYIAKRKPGIKEMRKDIFSHDAIYVGGGNTFKMIRRWRHLGLDKILIQAYRKGIPLAGSSAGAACWYEYAFSDYMKFYTPQNWKFVRIKGLGLLKGIICVHFKNKRRRIEFLQFIKKSPIKEGIALDDFCGIVYLNERPVKVVRNYSGVNAYKVVIKKGKTKIKPII